MRKLLRVRVNGWIYLASVCLYFAVISITALFSTLNIIGICYSGLTGITDEGERLAHYSYIVNEDSYSYSVNIEDTADFLVPQLETVFYFKEYPSVRTGAAEIFIYPAFTAVLGLASALLIRHGSDELTDESPTLGMYALPIALSAVSLIPICLNVREVCGLYTSVMSAFENAKESVYSASISLELANLNLLMWGIWAKLIERRKAKGRILKGSADK